MTPTLNDLIRAAAGRRVAAPEVELERPVGDFLGRGKPGPPPFPRPPSTSTRLNDEIRAAAGIVRGRYTFDDLYRG
jgi:hypothetical protein